MIWILLYCLIYPVIDSYSQVYLLRKEKVNHISQSVLIALNTLVICLAINLNLQLIDLFELAFTMLLLRWIMFDLSFNYWFGNKLLYCGKTALTDKLGYWGFLIKCFGLFFTILFWMQWLI